MRSNIYYHFVKNNHLMYVYTAIFWSVNYPTTETTSVQKSVYYISAPGSFDPMSKDIIISIVDTNIWLLRAKYFKIVTHREKISIYESERITEGNWIVQGITQACKRNNFISWFPGESKER